MQKYFYGFRYFSKGNTTTGEPNKVTGNFSIAGELVVFIHRESLRNWLANEKLSTPSGLGGGERVTINKKRARQLDLGTSLEDYNFHLECLQDAALESDL